MQTEEVWTSRKGTGETRAFNEGTCRPVETRQDEWEFAGLSDRRNGKGKMSQNGSFINALRKPCNCVPHFFVEVEYF